MPAEPSPIEPFFQEAAQALAILTRRQEISLASSLGTALAKALVLVTLSYFEVRITNAIEDALRAGLGDGPLLRFVKSRATERRFHSLFDWDHARNASHFLGLFGDELKQSVQAALQQRLPPGAADDLATAFLKLGRLRNRLAHDNFAVFPLTDTLEDIYQDAQRAEVFVEIFVDEMGKSFRTPG